MKAKSMTEYLAGGGRGSRMKFEGEWLAHMGQPERRGTIIICGPSFNGKTRYAIKLCKQLSYFTKVLYNSFEEAGRDSLRQAFEQEGMRERNGHVQVLDGEPMDELAKRLSEKRSAGAVIIDSLQYTRMSYEQYVEFTRGFPDKLFVFISHADGKKPAGSTAERVWYDAGVKVWVSLYTAYAQSRYGGGQPYVVWSKRVTELSVNKIDENRNSNIQEDDRD